MIKSIKMFVALGVLSVAFVSSRGVLASSHRSLGASSRSSSKFIADSAFKARMSVMLNSAVSSVNSRMRGRVQVRARPELDVAATQVDVESN